MKIYILANRDVAGNRLMKSVTIDFELLIEECRELIRQMRFPAAARLG